MSSQTPHFKGEETQDAQIIQQDGTVTFKLQSLSIIWGNDKRYWRLPEKNTTDGCAELIQVCWLEISASIHLSKLQARNYKISFKISMKSGAFGWNGNPIQLMAKIGKKGNFKRKPINLAAGNIGPNSKTWISLDEPIEIEESHLKLDDKLYFGLYEIDSGRWKGGLLIHEAKITPLI